MAFFEGRTVTEGTTKVVMRKPYKVRSDGVGRIESDGTLLLVQKVVEDGKPLRERRWRIRQVAPNRFTGTMSDASGPVEVEKVGSRFRFSFLEEPERVAAAFDDARSDREFAVACKQLRYDLDRIETEAAELGVLDREAFVSAFGAQRRAQTEAFVEGWDEAKAALLERLPDPSAPLTPRARGEARAAVAAFLAAMERENRGFVLAALDAYREEVAR